VLTRVRSPLWTEHYITKVAFRDEHVYEA
jgi:hypothetical protein